MTASQLILTVATINSSPCMPLDAFLGMVPAVRVWSLTDRQINNILVMSSDLRESLLLRRPTKTRRSIKSLIIEEPKQNKEKYAPINEQAMHASVTSAELEWQSSEESGSLVQPRAGGDVRFAEGLRLRYWDDSLQERKEKSLNDKVFNLAKGVQRRLYWFNMVMNTLMRVSFVNLLVFLAVEQKRIYLILFLSLEVTAMLLYLIIMIKMLITRSDKESVYFQKIFNESDWADIEAERVMRSHFGVRKILDKLRTLFNPCTKFEKDTKISFLRQEIFKRIELVLVICPFVVVFLINKDDFTTENYPNFSTWITAGITLETFRTVVTYLTIFVYS